MAQVYRQNPSTAGRIINGMAFVITPGSNTMHTLNPTAALVWELAKSGFTVEQAATALSGRYDVAQEVAVNDIAECCTDLVRRGILVPDE